MSAVAHTGTLLLVATTGGHLAQLHEIADRLPVFRSRLWVTFDSAQARSVLRGQRVVYIPEITERDLRGVLRALPTAGRLYAQEASVSTVVSTGSAIALAFLPYAALRGIPAHYIESAARTNEPSLTGRLLSGMPGIRLYRQYEHRAVGRWRYSGSVFDGFAVQAAPGGAIRRIVVTVGTMPHGFRRLIERLVAILPKNITGLWQTGGTDVEGLGIDAKAFVPADVIEAAIRDADVVVAHAGCGSALTAIKAGKCPVLVPRRPGAHEIGDPHQTEIAAWLDRRGLAIWREAEALCLADLECAAARTVVRAERPPPFRLEEFI